MPIVPDKDFHVTQTAKMIKRSDCADTTSDFKIGDQIGHL